MKKTSMRLDRDFVLESAFMALLVSFVCAGCGSENDNLKLQAK